MKKYIFLGGLVGFLLGLNSMMIGVGGQITYYVGLSFIADKLVNLIGGDFGISIAILLVFLVPIIVYGFLGYILGTFLKRK